MPKPFRGHVGLIQRNAIQSWIRLVPRPQIVLFGDEEGVASLADEFGLEHVSGVQRNEQGTPLIDGMFRVAHQRAVHPTMVYMNADIILLEDFSRAVGRIAAAGWDQYLMIGRRTDTDIFESLDFSRADWSRRLLRTVSRSGTLAPRVCKDYFVFRKPMFAEVPPFAIGRAVWDNWFVLHARQQGLPVIDASRALRAIHQNHDHGHAGGRGQVYLKGPEAKRNRALAGGIWLIKGSTCTWIMTPHRIRHRWIPSDLVQFALDLPRFLLLVCELYGWKTGFRARQSIAEHRVEVMSSTSRMPDYRLPNGLRVFSLAKTDTDMVYQEIFVEDVYRQHGVTLRDGDCIFDVGANTGLFEIFLDQVCASATVYAFEPIPSVFDVLRRNVSLCSHLDVRLHNLGLSRQAGQAEFTYFPHLSCASTMYPDDSREEAERARQYILGQFDQLPQRWLSRLLRCCLPPFRRWIADQVRRYYRRGQRIVCPLDTLSSVIRQAGVPRIDLLKLDAERSELDVLAGIESSDWPKIRQVVVEVHNGDEASDQVRRLLSSQGLQVVTDRNPHFSNIQMLYAVRPTL